MPHLLDTLLAPIGHRAPCNTLGEWLPSWRAAHAAHATASTYATAISAALKADRLAWAFFCGYQGAIRAAFPGAVAPGQIGALCVHETGRKITEIATTVHAHGQDWRLQGHKSWVLSDAHDIVLLVLARNVDGPPKGPGSLLVVRLLAGADGVHRDAPRPQSVVPEFAHTGIRFDSVRLAPDQLVPGDGYADYAKPFRAREDIFVTGCALAYLLAEAQSGAWPTTWAQRCVAAIVTLENCAALDPRDAHTHILVAGALSFAGEVVRESESHWTDAQAIAHARWQRDKPLLALGKEARRQRAVGSWSSLGWQSAEP